METNPDKIKLDWLVNDIHKIIINADQPNSKEAMVIFDNTIHILERVVEYTLRESKEL